MNPVTPRLREDRMKDDLKEVSEVVVEIGQAITDRDWDHIEYLTERLTELADDIRQDNHNLVLNQYCAPPPS